MEIIDKPNWSSLDAIKKNNRFYLPIKENDLINALTRAYNTEVVSRGNKIETMPWNAIEKVAQWLSSKEGRVGLLLYGTVGTGKTTMLNAICRVINTCARPDYNEITLDDDRTKAVKIIRAKDVIEAWQNDRDRYKQMCRVELLGIDEFGVEAIDVKTFGNANEPIIDLLSTRYDKQRCTMISSNLDMEAIGNRYGDRLQDRFVEMFKTIAFTGKSFRK